MGKEKILNMKKEPLLKYIPSVRTNLTTKLLFILILFSYTAQTQDLEVITSTPAKEGEHAFA